MAHRAALHLTDDEWLRQPNQTLNIHLVGGEEKKRNLFKENNMKAIFETEWILYKYYDFLFSFLDKNVKA